MESMKGRKTLPSGLLLFGALLLFALNMAPAPAEQKAGGSPLTELTLERSYCYGSCPAYKATIRSDGSVVYIGRGYVAHKGTFVTEGGGYTQFQFRRLAELANTLRLEQLKPSYLEAVSDVPHTTATFTRAGKRQAVESCCEKEPVSLWGYEMAFDSVLAETWGYAKWKRTAKPKP